jgi:hypothetical protein
VGIGCAAIVLTFSLHGQTFPFPQHAVYAPGVIKPSNVTQASMDNTVSNFWYTWKGRYLKAASTGGYYVYYNYENPTALEATVSEAHGYGMVLAAYMAGADPQARTYVDGLYGYYTNHPSGINPRLMSWQQDTNFNNIGGNDSATDGDLDIAYGLLLAHQQWGSAGSVNYFSAATNIIYAIMQSEVNQTQWTLRFGDWATSGTSHGYGYSTATRASDFMLEHLLVFFEATGDGRWTNVYNRSVGVINTLYTNYSPSTGLIPDFVVLSNSIYQPAPADFLEDSTDGQYGYNSCRTPWRFATEYILTGDTGPLTELRKLNGWVKTKTGSNPNNVYPGYTLGGTALDTSYTDSSFTSPFGVSAMTDSTNQAWLNSLWTWCVNGGINGNDGYFGNSIKLQSMLVISGNWWRPAFFIGDSDGDRIPDAWMRQFFGHPTGLASDQSRVTEDADSDGFANRSEYLAGTNPTNAISNLRILSVRASGVDNILSWTTAPGNRYRVQAAAGLLPTNTFADISPAITASGAAEGSTNYLDSGGLTNKGHGFYRIRIDH